MNWIKVKDKLPDMESRFLICHKDGYIEVVSHFNSEWLTDGCCGNLFSIKKILYWMPLPESPKDL